MENREKEAGQFLFAAAFSLLGELKKLL
jgi:hypothetical protein